MTENETPVAGDTPVAETTPTPTPAPAPVAAVTVPTGEEPLYFWGTGRRKTSVARVRLKPGGAGNILVNKKPFSEYFYRAQDQKALRDPLELTKTADRFDVFVNVAGGGMSGQSGAARMGIARALAGYDLGLGDVLRASGFLTRDARSKERKKYGQRGARASFQFSKR